MQLRFPFPTTRKDTFANLIVDERNAHTASICKTFATGEDVSVKSLVVYGAAGSGKTHLLCAMGDMAAKDAGEEASLYLDGAALVEAVESAATYEELKGRIQNFESAFFLAVDNLDIIEGNNAAEDQVFHLYNAVVQSGGRFAAAVAKPPVDWKFQDHLSTRLLWGHALAVNPVGDGKRVSVLIKVAADLGVKLPENVAQWLLTRLSRDPKEQIAAIEAIDRHSLTTGKKVSISLVREALGQPPEMDGSI
ncbi:MAG: ATP-binding protein [Nitrospinae bacterium]|nr:ATP-binding protein [Nitrospinota bacterium]